MKNNATVGSQISNTAYIYFDFNAPVVTNATLNSVISTVGLVSINNQPEISVYPNSTHGEFTVYGWKKNRTETF